MPNWCRNLLTVFGPETEVARFIEKAKGPTQHYPPQFPGDKNEPGIEALSFHQLVPIPDKIMKKQYDPHGIEAEQRLWGIKWGGSDSKLVDKGNKKPFGGFALYTFQTPWRPPSQFLASASKKFPKLTFVLSWSEEMPTRGREIVKNGKRSQVEFDEPTEKGCKRGWENKYVKKHDEWAKQVAMGN